MTDKRHFLPIRKAGGGALFDEISTLNTFLMNSVEWIILRYFIGKNDTLTEK